MAQPRRSANSRNSRVCISGSCCPFAVETLAYTAHFVSPTDDLRVLRAEMLASFKIADGGLRSACELVTVIFEGAEGIDGFMQQGDRVQPLGFLDSES